MQTLWPCPRPTEPQFTHPHLQAACVQNQGRVRGPREPIWAPLTEAPQARSREGHWTREAFQAPGEPCRQALPRDRERRLGEHLHAHLGATPVPTPGGRTCICLRAWVCAADHLLPASLKLDLSKEPGVPACWRGSAPARAWAGGRAGGRGCNPSLVGAGQRSSVRLAGAGPAGLLRGPQRQYSRSMLAISSSSE